MSLLENYKAACQVVLEAFRGFLKTFSLSRCRKKRKNSDCGSTGRLTGKRRRIEGDKGDRDVNWVAVYGKREREEVERASCAGSSIESWENPSPLRRDRLGVNYEVVVKEVWESSRALDEVLQTGPRNSQVTRAALQSLQGTSWVSDEVVNFYLRLIQDRCNCDPSKPEVYTFMSYFYSLLVDAGGNYCYENVRRWTRKDAALLKDIIMMPVNYKNRHWGLILMRLQEGIVELYDSLGCVNAEELFQNIQRWIHDEQNDKGIDLGIEEWSFREVRDAHLQEDFHSCGVYICAFAEKLAAGQNPPFDISQRDIAGLRLGIAANILACSLD